MEVGCNSPNKLQIKELKSLQTIEGTSLLTWDACSKHLQNVACSSDSYRAVSQAWQRNYGSGLSGTYIRWGRHFDEHRARIVVCFCENIAWIYHLHAFARLSGARKRQVEPSEGLSDRKSISG